MVQINFARREVNCKIVFYGPGLSGKTTNLEIIHKKVPDTARGNLTSIATEQDRTLFFDFMPLDLGQVAGMKTKLFLYTVPGQVYYDSTRKLVLQGADGVSFIADSDPNRMSDNIESFRNLEKNLKEYGVDIRKIPIVIQYNKRDLPGALSVAELNAKMNSIGAPTFEAVAVKGEGVMQTLKGISKLVVDRLNEEYAPVKTASTPAPGTAQPAARPASAPAMAAPAARTAPVPAAAAPSRTPVPPPAAVRPPAHAPAHPPAHAPARPAPAPARPQAPVRTAAPPPLPPVKKGGKGGLVAVLILLLLVLGGLAAWHFQLIPGLPTAPWNK
ncbi:MAG TPA: ADP-ribosylation factor-like protein [Planctomycetota bacterium]|nr:ADP-ribosylation factor-like protein [Planctomycetota bacterium]